MAVPACGRVFNREWYILSTLNQNDTDVTLIMHHLLKVSMVVGTQCSKWCLLQVFMWSLHLLKGQ